MEYTRSSKSRSIYERHVKRVLDFTLALLLIVCLSPALLLAAFLVRVKLGSPVFFRQMRVGKDGKFFYICKFKTMLDPQTRDGKKLSDNELQEALSSGRASDLLTDEERLTKFGRFMRKASLDELPELFNILTGKMSFVGPRPMFMANYEYYTPTENRRHELTPGLTGLAQVNGRSMAPWERRFEDDVFYVDHVSFWLDLKIFMKTFLVVFTAECAAQGTEASVPFTTQRLQQLVDFANVGEDVILSQTIEERRALLKNYEAYVEKKKGIEPVGLRAA